MLWRMGVAVMVVFLLPACSWQGELPTVPETHPANPQAEASVPLQPSDVLGVREPVEAPPAVPTMHHGMQGHGQHNHMMDMAHGER